MFIHSKLGTCQSLFSDTKTRFYSGNSIHCLRHTHAVLLLESGATMKYIQERLGGCAQITADVYAHISKKIEKDTMSNFEDYSIVLERGVKKG